MATIPAQLRSLRAANEATLEPKTINKYEVVSTHMITKQSVTNVPEKGVCLKTMLTCHSPTRAVQIIFTSDTEAGMKNQQ